MLVPSRTSPAVPEVQDLYVIWLFVDAVVNQYRRVNQLLDTRASGHRCSLSMAVPKVHAASAAFVFGMEETRLKSRVPLLRIELGNPLRDQLKDLFEGDGAAFVSVFDPTVNSGERFGVHRYFFGHRNVPVIGHRRN